MLFNLADWCNCLELWCSTSISFGRCIGRDSTIFSKYGFKKIFNKIIILKKNIYFDNKL